MATCSGSNKIVINDNILIKIKRPHIFSIAQKIVVHNDLASFDQFWARGQKGGEIIQKFKIGGIKGAYPDSAEVEFGPLELTDSWQQWTINLADKDLSYISGGLAWSTSEEVNPETCTFYLDEIRFE